MAAQERKTQTVQLQQQKGEVWPLHNHKPICWAILIWIIRQQAMHMRETLKMVCIYVCFTVPQLSAFDRDHVIWWWY
jgi:hypothetical protein